MPKPHDRHKDHHTIMLVIIVAIVAFGLGYIFARAKYKTQLKTTYNMVVERDSTIKNLNTKIQQIQTLLEDNKE
jgi:hypothetical protein